MFGGLTGLRDRSQVALQTHSTLHAHSNLWICLERKLGGHMKLFDSHQSEMCAVSHQLCIWHLHGTLVGIGKKWGDHLWIQVWCGRESWNGACNGTYWSKIGLYKTSTFGWLTSMFRIVQNIHFRMTYKIIQIWMTSSTFQFYREENNLLWLCPRRVLTCCPKPIVLWRMI